MTKLAGACGVVVGSCLTAVVAFAPAGAVRVTAYVGVLAICVVALLLGIRANRPAPERPWYVIVLGVALLSLAAALDPRLLGLVDSRVASELLAVVGYPLIGVGALGFARAQSSARDRGPALDSLLVAVALCTVLWEGVLGRADDVAIDLSEVGGLMIMAVAASWVAGMTTRVLLAGGYRHLSGWALFASSLLGVWACGVSVLAAGQGGPMGVAQLVAWAASAVLLAVAAVHRSMRHLTLPAEVARAQVISRMVLPGLAILTPPVAMVVNQLVGGTTPVVAAWASVVVGLIVVARFAGLVALQERTRQRLRYEATHDPLTGLANRTLLAERFAVLDRRPDAGAALLFVDLDHFKAINDQLGHRTGDRVLAAVADRLRQVVRREDLVVRFAGDEFVVLTDGGRAGATALAQRARAVVSAPIPDQDGAIHVGASVGVAVVAPDDELDDVLGRADAAMYVAKQKAHSRSVAHEVK